MKLLTQTEDAIIGEISRSADTVWTIGLNPTDDRRFQPENWLGHNYLGGSSVNQMIVCLLYFNTNSLQVAFGVSCAKC